VSSDLERLITELEEVTARMLAITCWEQSGKFGELLASRHVLAARLTGRQDLDASAAERIRAVIQGGNGLVARIMAMRESVLAAIAQTETQRCYVRELGGTVPSQGWPHHIDM
jgi:hypothetical protein